MIANKHKLLTASRRARNTEGNAGQEPYPCTWEGSWSKFISMLPLSSTQSSEIPEIPSYLNYSSGVICAWSQHCKLMLTDRKRNCQWSLDSKLEVRYVCTL